MKKTNKGFTLVELIIVIAVIGVLAAILIPTFANVIDKANRKSAFSDAKNALQLYLAEATTGENGGNCVPEGTVFEVQKANKPWFFVYTNNGLHEADDDTIKGDIHDYDVTGLPSSITDEDISGFPASVTMHYNPAA